MITLAVAQLDFAVIYNFADVEQSGIF